MLRSHASRSVALWSSSATYSFGGGDLLSPLTCSEQARIRREHTAHLEESGETFEASVPAEGPERAELAQQADQFLRGARVAIERDATARAYAPGVSDEQRASILGQAASEILALDVDQETLQFTLDESSLAGGAESFWFSRLRALIDDRNNTSYIGY